MKEHRGEEDTRRYNEYCVKILKFCPKLKTILMQEDTDPPDVTVGVSAFFHSRIHDPHSTLQLKLGLRAARSSDANTLKVIAGTLASLTSVPLALSSGTKSDRGFNNDDLGRMLVPIEDFKAYQLDPKE